jgi:RNase P protein component
LRKSFWIVLVARKDAATAGYRALEHEWLRLARRASILL